MVKCEEGLIWSDKLKTCVLSPSAYNEPSGMISCITGKELTRGEAEHSISFARSPEYCPHWTAVYKQYIQSKSKSKSKSVVKKVIPRSQPKSIAPHGQISLPHAVQHVVNLSKSKYNNKVKNNKGVKTSMALINKTIPVRTIPKEQIIPVPVYQPPTTALTKTEQVKPATVTKTETQKAVPDYVQKYWWIGLILIGIILYYIFRK